MIGGGKPEGYYNRIHQRMNEIAEQARRMAQHTFGTVR